MSIIPTEHFEEISIRVAPGEYINFPVIDNKGLFQTHKRTEKSDGYRLESIALDEFECYGIYKCEKGLAYLVAAFFSDDEIPESVSKLILKTFPFLLAELNINLKETFPELKISLHMDLVEPYSHTIYASLDNEYIKIMKIEDPRNLSQNELFTLKMIPGLSDKIQKLYS
ncbi:MAG: hypothetical protein KH310_20155 [Enterobacteriaceae bacterium]|nr:hypothetical protein [Enterobacteriaceae bacterium]